MSTTPHIAGLTSKNIFLVEFREPYGEKTLRDESTTNIRSIVFSPKGTYLAYRTDKKAEIIRCSDWSVAAAIDGNIKDMFFSPLDNYFVVWEMFLMTKENPQGKPNLHVYKSETGECIGSFTQKNQGGWEPKWSSDEKLFAIQLNARIVIYEDAKLDRFVQQFSEDKLKSFSISPGPGPNYYFSVFTLGKQAQPSFWRVYSYPKFNVQDAIVSRSSFQADKASFYWNRRGTNMFTLTSTDVDKTGGSYYGKQSLSYGDVKGNAGNVTFSKEGPIHAIAWNPGNWGEWVAVYGHTPAKATLFNAKCDPIFELGTGAGKICKEGPIHAIAWNPGNWGEWVAVYGHAPAKATLFNAKCDPLFEFGTGAWNSIYFPPEGNHVLLGGFGNIASGHIEVWDVRGYKKLGACAAPDSTYLQWDPRGEVFVTATTYPRLTVGNGYKVWHYTGALMHKRPCQEKEHLLAITWRPGNYPKSELAKTPPKTIEDTTPKPTAAYRPPGARNKPSTFTLHEHEKPHKPGENASGAQVNTAGLGARKKREDRDMVKTFLQQDENDSYKVHAMNLEMQTAPSKQAIKQKEKREARKARKADEKASGDVSPTPPAASSRSPFITTGDAEKDKKIKNVNKKLSDIDKLKQQKAAGKQLELNQLAKIENEPALLKELEQLRL